MQLISEIVSLLAFLVLFHIKLVFVFMSGVLFFFFPSAPSFSFCRNRGLESVAAFPLQMEYLCRYFANVKKLLCFYKTIKITPVLSAHVDKIQISQIWCF